jgi:hypothetical protein
MDINQIIFIAVIIFLLYVFVIHPYMSQTKTARYHRYFHRLKNTRFAYVKQCSKDPEYLPNDLSIQELVAVLAFISAKDNPEKAHLFALQLSDSNLKEKMNEDFFTYLFATGKRFSNIRWFQESMDMLNLGRLLAKQLNKDHWLAEFNDAINYVNRLRTTGNSASLR